MNPFEEVIGFEVLDESKQTQHQLHQAIAGNGRFRVSLMAPVSEFH
ncbi:hypothetical protein [Enterovibrio coralii]|nr:hypothetical protein [Enterovibrio coralii]